MPRFAILIHDHPFVHWDLLLESGDSAQTWRLLESPERWRLSASPMAIPAEPIAPHRLLYLDYEGPVSHERGHVVRWDAGTFERLHDEPPSAKADIRVRLNGSKLNFICSLNSADSEATVSKRC